MSNNPSPAPHDMPGGDPNRASTPGGKPAPAIVPVASRDAAQPAPPFTLEIEPFDAPVAPVTASNADVDWTLEIEPLVPEAAAPGAGSVAPPGARATTLSAGPARLPPSPFVTVPDSAPTPPGIPDWRLEHGSVEAPRDRVPVQPPGHDLEAPVPRAREVAVHRERLRFHGRGSEYFRIWVVNLFLTLITLGVYSAWAKVRKARWFAQNTSLAGDRFDYHGEPWRVLVGRLVAIVLLAVWTFAFDFSAVAGLVVLGVFCVVGPLLFASAQRFRLANTSWRGLRFGFDVPRREVYLVCVPLLLLWTAGSVLDELGISGAWYVLVGLATIVGLPWAHARLKQLQHHHANYGEQQFAFRSAGNAFYGLYLKALLLVVVGSAVSAPALVMLAQSAGTGQSQAIYAMLVVAVVGLFGWLAAWPYFAARMQQIVWSHTELGHGIRFTGHMKGSRLWLLVVGQTLLTLLTLGLYWPFAAVAITRYRVESIEVDSDDPIGEVAGSMSIERRAAGDAAVDFFGLDLGW
jgi:uncharacterized membrane protein YjgN (DUF898 family)